MAGKVTPRRLPNPRTMLGWDGTDFFALKVDDDGHLQIEVTASAQPEGVAQQATLNDCKLILADLRDLTDALASVATDRLIVRGEDQLFSFLQPLTSYRTGAISGADGYFDSAPVGAGEVWGVTNIVCRDRTTALTDMRFAVRSGGADFYFYNQLRAIALNEMVAWGGLEYMDTDDVFRIVCLGSLAGDTMDVWVTGYRMTREV